MKRSHAVSNAESNNQQGAQTTQNNSQHNNSNSNTNRRDAGPPSPKRQADPLYDLRNSSVYNPFLEQKQTGKH